MRNPVCPATGAPMQRGVQPMTLTYKGASLTIDMPGWYCTASGESTHTGEDMKVSDRALNRLKACEEGLPIPEDTGLMSAAFLATVTKGRVARRIEDLDDKTVGAIARSEVSAEHAHLDDLIKDRMP